MTEKISRLEFDRITCGAKQYAMGKLIDIPQVMRSDDPIVIWYRDRPYMMPPPKHTGKIELTKNMKVLFDTDGTKLPELRHVQVTIEPDLYRCRYATDITGSVSVVSDGRALHELIETNTGMVGEYVSHAIVGKFHVRPHIIYKNDNVDLVVTYKDGMYLVSEHTYDGKVFSKPLLVCPMKEGAIAFLIKAFTMKQEDIVAAIPVRTKSEWMTKTGTTQNFHHLHRMFLSMRRIDCVKAVESVTEHGVGLDHIVAACYELTLRTGYTMPTKQHYSRTDIFEPGRVCLPDGGDVILEDV